MYLTQLTVVALFVVLLAETLVLRTLWQDVTLLKDLFEHPAEQRAPEARSLRLLMPEFALERIDGDGVRVSRRDLVHRHCVMLFAAPFNRDFSSLSFLAMIEGAFSQTDEDLYVVFEGDLDSARQLRDEPHLRAALGDRLIVLSDPAASLRRALKLLAGDVAVVFNEDGRVEKVGQARSSPTLEPTKARLTV